MKEMRNEYSLLENLKGRHRRRWEDNIRMDLGKIA
jgi:hypothetical protein